MEKYYKFLIAFFFLFFASSLLFLFSHRLVMAPKNYNNEFVDLKINGKIIYTEIADSDEKREKGLSGRQSLAENSGMLFVFDALDYYSFWMKDMNFSLDFIWISGNEIIEITRNVKPEDYQPASTRRSSLGGPPRTLISRNKVDKVLEVNAGTADRLGIREGNLLEF